MKTSISLATALGLLAGCQAGQELGTSEHALLCSESTHELLAGQTIDVGHVGITQDETQLCVNYVINQAGWFITQTHVAIAADPDLLPQNRSGNPQIGAFPYGQSGLHATFVQTCVNYINAGYTAGQPLYVAAHAVVIRENSSGQVVQSETAWGDGYDFEGRSWAMYFDHTLQECVPVPPPPPPPPPPAEEPPAEEPPAEEPPAEEPPAEEPPAEEPPAEEPPAEEPPAEEPPAEEPPAEEPPAEEPPAEEPPAEEPPPAPQICGWQTYNQDQWGSANPAGCGAACSEAQAAEAPVACYRDAHYYEFSFTMGCVGGQPLECDPLTHPNGCNSATYLGTTHTIEHHLPTIGAPRTLTAHELRRAWLPGDQYDPVIATELFGNAVALALNIGYDSRPDFKVAPTAYRLADLVVADPASPCLGLTVQQVLDVANNVIGGCSSVYSATAVNSCLVAINESFNASDCTSYLATP